MTFTTGRTKFHIGLPFVLLLAAYGLLGLKLEAAIAFLSVAAHEFAHALMASAYDLNVNSVELTPFGGVTRLTGLMEQDPYVETSVAIAGPASSFLLAGLAIVLWRMGFVPQGPVSLVIDYNLLLGILNLIPALPLDGGRVIRAGLSRRLGYRRATGIVGGLGRWLSMMAFVFGTLLAATGVFIPNIFVYSVFGYIFAVNEEKWAPLSSVGLLIRRKEALARQGVVKTQDFTATSSTTLERVARGFSTRHYSTVTVLGPDMRAIGTLTETEIVEHIMSGRGQQSLGDIVLRV